MDDDARALFNHRRQERPVQAHGGKQIEVKFPLPLVVVEHREAAGRRGRAADDVDNDVNTAKMVANRFGNGRAALSSGDVCSDEHLICRIVGARSRRGQDIDAGLSQPGHNGFADTLSAAGDEGATTLELEGAAHRRISSETILSPSISKI